MLRESTNFFEESVEKSWGKELSDESGLKFIPRFNSSFIELVQPYPDEFINAFVRISFGSTIKLVSFDESQVVNINGKFVCGFRNGDCEIESQSDNTVDSSHGFIIYGIEVFDGNEEVTKVIDVENWRIDNSRVLRWVVSLIEWNSSVSSMKSLIPRYGVYAWRMVGKCLGLHKRGEGTDAWSILPMPVPTGIVHVLAYLVSVGFDSTGAAFKL
uniref:Uncharacterized protein n=1 Tax=Tanacetum cinerariifolium TaxID=118510 RepID=A0A699GTU6_TANCI|nr:hypothetical protein [Tanacetum cinerariifolium]